jgi:N-acylethanolamine-hydrolysing acid amidase
VYIILSGVSAGEGAVITRNREGADCSAGDACGWGVMQLWGVTKGWYVLVSNYDPWLPDVPTDPRATVAKALMNAAGQAAGATLANMFAVLSTPPILNSGTKYTALMYPAEGTLSAVVRQANATGAAK